MVEEALSWTKMHHQPLLLLLWAAATDSSHWQQPWGFTPGSPWWNDIWTGGLVHPEWIYLSARDIDPQPQDAPAPVSTQFSSTFLQWQGRLHRWGNNCATYWVWESYLLGCARSRSKWNTSSCCWLGNAQIVREFRDNCTNTRALLTDVQRHPRSFLLLSEAPGQVPQQSNHRSDYYF